MALFQILRDLGSISPEEIDAAAYRAVACAPAFRGLNWVRSFLDAGSGRMVCYYEALDADDLRRHAEMARIPCDVITEVTEYLPQTFR